MPPPPPRSLLVCGGSGFLGARICQVASQRNWMVASLSRSGEPTWPSSEPRPPWASKIVWLRGDVMDPATYRSALKGVDAVVHTMGILLEADYKGVLSGKEPLLSGLKKAFDSTRGTAENTVRAGKAALTYESMNRDSAVTLAEEALQAGIKNFLYVSAVDSFFALPKRYITTKREAEQRIGAMKDMRSVFLRPSFLYDYSRFYTWPLAGACDATSTINRLFGGRLPLLGAAGYKPLKVDDVAGAAIKALEDDTIKGVVGVDKIEELAKIVWREGML